MRFFSHATSKHTVVQCELLLSVSGPEHDPRQRPREEGDQLTLLDALRHNETSAHEHATSTIGLTSPTNSAWARLSSIRPQRNVVPIPPCGVDVASRREAGGHRTANSYSTKRVHRERSLSSLSGYGRGCRIAAVVSSVTGAFCPFRFGCHVSAVRPDQQRRQAPASSEYVLPAQSAGESFTAVERPHGRTVVCSAKPSKNE